MGGLVAQLVLPARTDMIPIAISSRFLLATHGQLSWPPVVTVALDTRASGDGRSSGSITTARGLRPLARLSLRVIRSN